MVRPYGSYLLRCWQFDEDEGKQRIEVWHLQSAERTTVTSLTAATTWIAARVDAPRLPVVRGPERPGATTRESAGR